MSQVSYGTITIVDTTDIARIYMVYAKSVSNTTPPSDELTWSESIASAPGEGDFIWQKTVVEKAITEEKTYSDPVCVTGSSGQGVEKIINYYCNYGQGQPEEDYSGWQLEIPEYDGSKPNYWTKVVVIYSDDTREDFQASGTIATFESEKVGTLDSLEVSLEPIQDLHGYDKPWSEGAGKNKLDQSAYTWLDATSYSNGVFTAETLSTFSSAMVRLYKNGAVVNTINKAPTEGSRVSINVTVDDTWDACFIGYRMGGASNIGGLFNKPSVADGTYTVSFMADKLPSTSVYGKFSNIQFESGSTATSYEPYTNICPISGWDAVDTKVAGKNLFDKESYDSIQAYIGNDSITYNASHTCIYMDCKPNTTYTASRERTTTNERFGIAWVKEIPTNGTLIFGRSAAPSSGTVGSIETVSVTTGADAKYVVIWAWWSGSDVTQAKNTLQLEVGSTATAYEPYDGQTITTTLPTTVYGGTVDVVGGKLDDNMAIVDLGTLNWVYEQGRDLFEALLVPRAKNLFDAVCSNYPFVGSYSVLVDKSCGYIYEYHVAIKDSTYGTDASAFKTAMSGVQLVYELATPTSYSLTPQEIQTLIGQNNIWSDGTVELRGHTISKRDVMIYKDNGLTDVVNKSAEANTNAAEALGKANDGIVSTTQLWYQTNSTGAPRVPASHNQVDQGTVTYDNWRSARPNNNVDSYKYYYYCYEYLHGDGTYTYSAEAILDTSNLSQYQIDQLQTRVKKIWSNSTGSYMASGINTGTGTNEVDIDDSSTYGFNSKSTTIGVSFNYNTIPLTSLGTDGVNLYSPVLTNGVITGSRLDATLSTNGLILNKGGIKAREGYSDFIYLSTDPYGNYSINGSTGISDWKQIIGTKFGVRADGTLYASSVNIQGILTAGAGSTIGPWTVSNNAIYNPSTKSSFNSDTVNGVYIGTDGIALGQGVFKVGADGVLDASGVSVSGDLTATNGFTVAQNNKILTSITSNGLVVYDGNGIIDSNIVAKFTGDGAQIGQNDGQGSILLQDYHSLKMFDKEALEIMNAPEYTSASTYEIGDIVTRYITEWEGLRPIYYECIADISTPMLWDSSYWKVINLNSYFYISDLRDRSGVAKLTETFTISSYALNPQRITVLYPLKSIKQVVVNGSIVNHEVQYNTGEYNITFIRPLFSAGDIVSIEYETEGSDEYKTKESDESSKIFLKAYTLGLRRPSSNIGPMSITTGAFNVASGFFSQAGGFWTEALGKASHAEGYSTKAYGNYAHAEGYNTQAGEPFDPEIVYWDGGKGLYAHAEGKDTYARGSCSHVQNLGTYTIYDNETVIGRYNKKEANPHADFSTERWAFVIGNGTSDSNRSNAFTVDWSGNLWCNNFYPVGSFYETDTNTNPSEILGFGEWTLIDKEFDYTVFTSGGVTWNTNACQSQTYVCLRKNHEIWFRLHWQNKVAYGDTSYTICTINPQYFGLTNGVYQESIIPGQSDGLNAYLDIVGINTSATVFTVRLDDTIFKTGSTSAQMAATGQWCYASFNLHFGYSGMDDAVCRSFKWKRTA